MSEVPHFDKTNKVYQEGSPGADAAKHNASAGVDAIKLMSEAAREDRPVEVDLPIESALYQAKVKRGEITGTKVKASTAMPDNLDLSPVETPISTGWEKPKVEMDATGRIGQLTTVELEKAAETLLRVFPKHVMDALRFHANDCHKIPIWQYLCGLLAWNVETSNLSTPLRDPAWVNPSLTVSAEGICKFCNEQFPAKRRGQVFCSNECAKAHATAEKARNRKAN